MKQQKPEPHKVFRDLREIRRKRGLPQKSLTVHPQMIGDWESGKRNPRWKSFIKWCEALNCEIVVRDLS